MSISSESSDFGGLGLPLRLPRAVWFNTARVVSAGAVRPAIASKDVARGFADMCGAAAESFQLSTRIFAFDLRPSDEVVVCAENGLPLIVRRDGDLIVSFDVAATQVCHFRDSKRPLYTYIPGFNIHAVPERLRRPVSNLIESLSAPGTVDGPGPYRRLPLTGFEFTLLLLNTILTHGSPQRHGPFQWPAAKRAVFVALHDVDTGGFLSRGTSDPLFRIEAKYQLRSTWFVPTTILNHRARAIDFLLESNQEIGWHGHKHDHRDHVKPFAQRAVRALATSCLSEPVHCPTGMRLPKLLKSNHLFELIEQSCPNLCYDTSFVQGIVPYYIWLNGRPSRILEIPTTVPTDIVVFNRVRGLSPARRTQAIVDAQIARTEKLIEVGAVVSIVTHPEKGLSERPDLLDVYEQYLAYISSRTDIWFATARELFNYWTGQTARSAS